MRTPVEVAVIRMDGSTTVADPIRTSDALKIRFIVGGIPLYVEVDVREHNRGVLVRCDHQLTILPVSANSVELVPS